jgi:protein-L-isoaspartate(D-aspartate) O-methyltransferase
MTRMPVNRPDAELATRRRNQFGQSAEEERIQAAARAMMVDALRKEKGIRDERVLEAMRRVPREAFVGGDFAASAYEDRALPIGDGQTISQPYVVAIMLEAAKLGPHDRVLEVGAGSGYAAAILGSVAGEVHGVERLDPLASAARLRLARLGFRNVHIHTGDGLAGWRDAAPYDAIVISASAAGVPDALREQMAVGGRLVMPVGNPEGVQMLTRIQRDAGGASDKTELLPVRFVPLVGFSDTRMGAQEEDAPDR